jgi:hypothetical protein
VFVVLMVIGIAGLVVMALPAVAGHGHAHPGHGHWLAPRHAPSPRPTTKIIPADPASTTSLLRFLPSPRAIFTTLALYGAFGNALVHAAHFAFAIAALCAMVPALLVEYFAVRPVWNLIFRFQGQPSSPLEHLVCAEARAVVPFRNGRGIVSTVRDGRVVQLSARLRDDDAPIAVKVGDRLRIEDVDAQRERVTVSLLPD